MSMTRGRRRLARAKSDRVDASLVRRRATGPRSARRVGRRPTSATSKLVAGRNATATRPDRALPSGTPQRSSRSSNATVTASPLLADRRADVGRHGQLVTTVAHSHKRAPKWHASILPCNLTSPRVLKNSTESGQTTYVQPPLLGLFQVAPRTVRATSSCLSSSSASRQSATAQVDMSILPGAACLEIDRRTINARTTHVTPEFDEPQTNGELTFFMAQQTSTGKSVVTARFNANPETFP